MGRVLRLKTNCKKLEGLIMEIKEEKGRSAGKWRKYGG